MAADVSGWDNAGLQYELKDGVAWLRMNRPHKRNAIDRPLRTSLLAAIHEVTENIDVRAAVITGNGGAFSSGADLTQEGGPLEVPPDRRYTGPNGPRTDGLLYGWSRLMNAIWHSEKPFLAAVNGVAAGGGCQLALACDLILASEEATFWEIFVRRGLPLEAGGAWILPRLVSLVRAKEIAIFGEPLTAADAEKWGMINRCVPADEFDETVRSWARRLASGHTIRIGHIKGQLNSSLESTMAATFKEEVTLLGLGGGEDSAEAIQAYIERRQPQFQGR
ncbi:MAG TPA: enoyl-CoA hydratase-related protein [Acidimicrobiales bacterium]|nr:enoyl-CoA hydratase-related protein [Acidimicrobiales bacterium]